MSNDKDNNKLSDNLIQAEKEEDRIAKDETYSDFFAFIKDLYGILGIGG